MDTLDISAPGPGSTGGTETVSNTCAGGNLTVSSSLPSFPGIAMLKVYNGATYLFVQSDRDSQTWNTGSGWDNSAGAVFTMTMAGLPVTISGHTAKVVYDSNDRVDPAHTSTGNTIRLGSAGNFSGTFGANHDGYQVKIYMIQ